MLVLLLFLVEAYIIHLAEAFQQSRLDSSVQVYK